MTPLRVTAELTEPVVGYGDGMHLDGIVAFGHWLGLTQEERDAAPPISDPWALDFPLPLGKWDARALLPPWADPRLTVDGGIERTNGDALGTVWGWRASAVIGDGIEGRHEVRKKPATEEMVRYTGAPSYHPGLGPAKSKDIPFPSMFARTVTWYAVGDRRGVEECLVRVVGVGKLANQGMGRVGRWTVEEVGEDWSIERDGTLMRRMPVEEEEEGAVLAGIRAPYHHPSRRALCVGPWASRD